MGSLGAPSQLTFSDFERSEVDVTQTLKPRVKKAI